jgi:hypothetical protein
MVAGNEHHWVDLFPRETSGMQVAAPNMWLPMAERATNKSHLCPKQDDNQDQLLGIPRLAEPCVKRWLPSIANMSINGSYSLAQLGVGLAHLLTCQR